MMNEILDEVVVTTIEGSRTNNRWIVWILLFLIIFGFTGNGAGYGAVAGTGPCCEERCKCKCKRKRHHNDCCCNTYAAGTGAYGGAGGFLGGPGGFFQGNGLFILIVFALLFLVGEGNRNTTNVIHVDAEDEDC